MNAVHVLQGPPREGLVRARHGGFHLRDDLDGGPPTMFGYLARFNEWAQIDGEWEGPFMERVAPGAFKKTIAESKNRMRVLFQHGHDPQVGDKPLGPISELGEDRQGAFYEVPLLDAPYVRDTILPGLRAGLYGASFRFSVPKEEWDRDPEPSDHNPDRLPERTLREIALKEFGPVTFPAYQGASAGVRSLVSGSQLTERLDSQDMTYLAQMIALGGEYIDEQDEPREQANIPRMQAVLATLTDLMAFEATEDEPAEPEDASSGGRNDALPNSEAATVGTSGRDAATKKTWPKAPHNFWEETWTP